MQPVTLQINSLEALERLMGGDSAVEIDIRNSVVQKFAEKHLKAVASTATITHQLDQMRETLGAEASKQVSEKIGKFKMEYGRAIFTGLCPEVKDALKTAVNSAVSDVVRIEVADQIAKIDIDALVNRRVTYDLNEIVNKKVKARMEAAARAITVGAGEEV